MIEKTLIPIGGLKKEPFSGCHHGMRYYLKMQENKESFMATTYPEPWSFEKTPEKDKECQTFPMSEEGMDAAIEWLHNMYTQKRAAWHEASKSSMHIVHKKQ